MINHSKKRSPVNTREKVLNSFKSNIFPINTPNKTPTTHPELEPTVFDISKPTKAQTKAHKDLNIFGNKTVNDEKNMNMEIFME